MNNRLFISIRVALALCAATFSCTPSESQDEKVEAPVVEYSIQEDVLDIKLNESISFGAEVTSSGPYSCAWYVDGVKVSNLNSVTYVFNSKGSFKVSFEISNEAGADSKEYTVNVTGEALVVEYSIAASETVKLVLGDELELRVTVTGGDKETVHSWSIGDEIVSGTSSLNHLFEVPGTYTVSYHGVNADDEHASASWTVKVADLPISASFTPEAESFEIFEKESVELSVKVSSGIFGLAHKWEVGLKDAASFETVSTGESFSYSFATPGSYLIRYTASNSDGGSLVKTWPVEVEKIPVLPLAISFSIEEESFNLEEGKTGRISATVTAGGDGIVHEWKVDGTVVSTENKVAFSLSGVGTSHIVSYKGENGAGELVSKTWTVNVIEASSVMFDDMEDATLGVSSFYDGNKVNNVNVMEIVENPYKTAANPSDKVLLDRGSRITWSSSAYFKFKTYNNQYGKEFSSAMRRSYTKVRVKVYIGDTGFTPLLQEDTKSSKSAPVEINGQAFNASSPNLDEWKKLIKTNDWNVFVYDVSQPKFSTNVLTLADVTQFQFRVAVDFNNSGKMPKDVYFDDIEFVK